VGANVSARDLVKRIGVALLAVLLQPHRLWLSTDLQALATFTIDNMENRFAKRLAPSRIWLPYQSAQDLRLRLGQRLWYRLQSQCEEIWS
jgi:hypothetical protein